MSGDRLHTHHNRCSAPHTHAFSLPSLCLHCYLLLLLLLTAKGLHTPLHLPPLHSDTHAARPKDCEVPLRIRRLNRKISVFICVTAYTEGANQLRRTLEAVAESLYERASRRHTVMYECAGLSHFLPHPQCAANRSRSTVASRGKKSLWLSSLMDAAQPMKRYTRCPVHTNTPLVFHLTSVLCGAVIRC